MPPPKEYWFPTKKYGYGWGLPCRWQGWVALAVYAALLAAGALTLLGTAHAPYFVLYVAVVSGAFVVVCVWKGEPPRWRWGGD